MFYSAIMECQGTHTHIYTHLEINFHAISHQEHARGFISKRKFNNK